MELFYVAIFAGIALWSYVCWSLYKAFHDDPLVVPPPIAAASAARPSDSSCSRSAGLDPAALLLLPVFVYSSAGGRETTAATAECAVCLAELEDGESGRVLPRCGHVFHRECIDVWLHAHSTCPVCRAAAAASPTVDDPDACGAGAGRSLDRVV